MDEHEDDPLAGENAWEEEDVETKAKAMNAAASHNDSMRTEIMDDGSGGGGVGGHGWLSNDSSRTEMMDSSRTELAEEDDDDDDTPLMRRRSSSGATAGLPASFKVPFLMTLPVSKHDPPTSGMNIKLKKHDQKQRAKKGPMCRPMLAHVGECWQPVGNRHPPTCANMRQHRPTWANMGQQITICLEAE